MRQVSGAVRWEAVVRRLASEGVRTYVEVGPRHGTGGAGTEDRPGRPGGQPRRSGRPRRPGPTVYCVILAGRRLTLASPTPSTLCMQLDFSGRVAIVTGASAASARPSRWRSPGRVPRWLQSPGATRPRRRLTTSPRAAAGPWAVRWTSVTAPRSMPWSRKRSRPSARSISWSTTPASPATSCCCG